MKNLTSFSVPWRQTRTNSSGLVQSCLLDIKIPCPHQFCIRTFWSGDPLTLKGCSWGRFPIYMLELVSHLWTEMQCIHFALQLTWRLHLFTVPNQIARRMEKGIANWKELGSITFPVFFSGQVVAELEHILDIYVLYFGQIHTLFPSFSLWLSGIWIEKWGWGLNKRMFTIWSNMYCFLDKSIHLFGQIHRPFLSFSSWLSGIWIEKWGWLPTLLLSECRLWLFSIGRSIIHRLWRACLEF